MSEFNRLVAEMWRKGLLLLAVICELPGISVHGDAQLLPSILLRQSQP